MTWSLFLHLLVLYVLLFALWWRITGLRYDHGGRLGKWSIPLLIFFLPLIVVGLLLGGLFAGALDIGDRLRR